MQQQEAVLAKAAAHCRLFQCARTQSDMKQHTRVMSSNLFLVVLLVAIPVAAVLTCIWPSMIAAATAADTSPHVHT